MRWVKVLSVVLVVAAWPHQATAGDDQHERAEARRQFDEGTRAFAAKRFREAALAFEAACEYRASGTALYTAGLAWAEAGERDRAADDFARALTTPGLGETESNEARARLTALQKTLGVVAVQAPEGTLVALDNHSPIPTPVKLHGTPGKHFVVARYPDDRVAHHVVVLRAGETASLELTPGAKPAAAPPAPCTAAPAQSSGTAAPMPARRMIGIGVLGAGLAAAGAAALLGAEALGSRDAYNAHPTSEGYQHASSMQDATNVAWAAAGILGAAGLTLVVWPTGKKPAQGTTGMWLMPTGLGMRGAF